LSSPPKKGNSVASPFGHYTLVVMIVLVVIFVYGALNYNPSTTNLSNSSSETANFTETTVSNGIIFTANGFSIQLPLGASIRSIPPYTPNNYSGQYQWY